MALLRRILGWLRRPPPQPGHFTLRQKSSLHGFVAVGVSKGEWTDDKLRPLEEYLRTLRAPVNLKSSVPSG